MHNRLEVESNVKSNFLTCAPELDASFILSSSNKLDGMSFSGISKKYWTKITKNQI